MDPRLGQFTAAGQSIWLDNIRRSMITSGELAELVERGVRGITSNPTIYEKAIGSGNDYDEQLRSIVANVEDTNAVFELLATTDVRMALDVLRPLYDQTGGDAGYVSLEVSPLLADDTDGTVDAAKRIWALVDRPNLLVKVPATPAGIPAVTELIARGINLNVTLIFSPVTYREVALAYIEGIRRRTESGASVSRIASVASVFVSRVDSVIDEELLARADAEPQLTAYLGRSAVANAKIIYQAYSDIFSGAQFHELRRAGARPQRPLWASTATKNPKYSDLKYVESLVGRETVNTVPPATLDAIVDHARVRPDSITDDVAAARSTMSGLADAGIDFAAVTERLQQDGVASFTASYQRMLAGIAQKRAELLTQSDARVSLGEVATSAGARALEALSANGFTKKLWSKDPSPWSDLPEHRAIIENALGWLHVPEIVHEHVEEIKAFAQEVRADFDFVVVLGMGGSSLAPDVMRATFGRVDGYPELRVLDSTDPAQINALEKSIDFSRSLFIVSSKSGTTIEPDAFSRYFHERVNGTVGPEGVSRSFIAITDPGTKLAQEATAAGFRRVFINRPDIGGRYSALSYFGMVPAAIAGYDIDAILDRAIGQIHANASCVEPREAPGVQFGAAIGALVGAGRDKLTLIMHPGVASFGQWVEQLIAESTGKSGTGIVPVEGETIGDPTAYANDRVFVYAGAGMTGENARDVAALARLEALGHPVIRLRMDDRLDIGEQFFLWEIAVATAGSVLAIDAFDQPNVQESKDNTRALLDRLARSGSAIFDEPTPVSMNAHAAVMPLSGSRDRDFGRSSADALAAVLGQVREGDYIAITAYLPMFPRYDQVLARIRTKLRDALHVSTTVGFGPRFLHSTGQLHKGGPPTGVFLQLTADPHERVEIPGMVDFGTLQRAQALGDFESLDKRSRRGLRLHLRGDVATALSRLEAAIDDSLASLHLTGVNNKGS